jgi:hypothetical protein
MSKRIAVKKKRKVVELYCSYEEYDNKSIISDDDDVEKDSDMIDVIKGMGVKLKNNKYQRFIKINNDFGYSVCGNLCVMVMYKNNYVNASKLCHDANKQFHHWKANITSKELISELSSAINIPINELILTVAGGKNIELRGTYVHPKLIIHIASWCGPSFAIKVSEWIDEWRNYSSENEDRFYTALSNIKPSPSAAKEKEIQKMLHKKLGGKIEVKTIAGRIDLLTDKYLIEIKNYCDWKCAIGQLIAYSRDYEDKKKVMYLFDIPKKNIMDYIIETCAEYNITVKAID